MEQLLVRLASDDTSPVSWLIWSSDESDVIASGVLPDASHLSTLTERAGQRAIISLVPTSEVLLKWVTLPPRAGRKVLNAIPFMLEDELSEDVADLFFALGPRQGDQQAVAIVRHEQMARWKNQLLEAGLQCEQVVPDVLAVPYNEDGMSLLTLNDLVLVREDKWKGFQGEPGWIIPALSHATKQSDTQVKIYNYSDLELFAVPNVEVIAQTLELPMAVLAQQALSAQFNLFQGDYKTRKKTSKVSKQWRVAAVLAVLAFCTTLADKVLTIQSLSAKNAELKMQIDEQVNLGFPDIGAYRDLRRKVNSELAKLEQNGSGGASILAMLTQLEPAFSQSRVKPQSLRFDSGRNELRMQALATNFESLEQFKRSAEDAGFVVEQGAINNRPEGVVGSLALRSDV